MDKLIEIVDDLIKKEEIEWDEIINEIIKKNVIDPKNIDLDVLIDYYIKIIKELKKREDFDFILSSKVLVLLVYFLKLKVEFLAQEFYGFSYEDEVFFDEEFYEEKEEKKEKKKKEIKKELKLKLIFERKRKVTIEDLKEAIKEILKKEENRKKRKKIKKESLEDLATLEYDIEKETELILQVLERYEEIDFFELIKIFKPKNIKEEIVKKFIPLLYLDFQEKVEVYQKRPFEDLLIKKLKENKDLEN